MSTKQATEKAIGGRRKPMTVAEIADAAIPVSNLRGATPKGDRHGLPADRGARA